MKAHDNQLVKSDDVLPMGSRIFGIIGPKGSGKSSIMLSLLTSKKSPFRKYFNNIFLVSPTAKYDDKMKPLQEEVDSEGKYWDALTEQTAQEIIEMIPDLNKGVKKPQNLIILDDVTHSFPTGKKPNAISALFTNSRHLKSSIWVVTHKYTSMPPIFRNQMDCLFIFRTNSKVEIESFKRDLTCDEEMFEEKLKQATEEDHSFLFINLVGGKCVMYKRFDEI
jgi:ABC-type dipeptide/oligopeptide/nickel transport system ATPase component